MKKIIVGLTAAVVAIGVQASTVSWTCTNVYKDNSTVDKATGGSAYIFFAANADQATAWIKTLTDAAGQGTTAFNAALENASFGYNMPTTYEKDGETKSVSAGMYTYNETIFGSLKSTTELGISDKTTYTAFAVIIDSTLDKVTDSSTYYVTSTKEFTTGDGADDTAQAAIGSQQGYTKGIAAWNQVGAVPEPTSGLLLLLGVAGLALRRRRA